LAGPIWFDHAPFSPWIRRGNYWLDEFSDEGRHVEDAIGGVTYRLLGAAACNGIAVPELVTGQVEIKPVVIRTRTGNGRLMY
jgi:hypothetical protein